MRIRKYLLTGILLASFVSNVAGQAGQLPTIIPPSPEVASFARLGNISTGLHTGSAAVTIPLYQLSAGTINMPLALAYSSNGIKVNDIASKIGMSWNLLAGGSISRIIHDEADGESNYLPPPANPEIYNQALLTYLIQADMEGNDTEFDEYSYSFNGQSGKFFLDPSTSGKSVEHNNLRIVKSGSFFIVTAADGTKYYFGEGGKVEKTSTITWQDGNHKTRINTTAWMLTKIESPEGDVITFSYQPIHIKVDQGLSQTVILKQSSYVGSSSDCNLCNGSLPAPVMNRIEYDTYYLTSIISSNGTQIDFLYAARPDLSGDNRLTELSVLTTNGQIQPLLVKKYQFQYQDISTGGLNKKFYLNKIISVPTNTSLPNTEHTFDYIAPAELPSQSSYSQDYFGYYNGKTNGNLFPIPTGVTGYVNAGLGANRNPDFTYAKKGMLQKVTYPTGGSDEFIYEPHTILENQSTTTYNTAYVGGGGTGLNLPNTFITYFTVQNSQNGQLFINGAMSQGAPPQGDPLYYPADGSYIFADFFLINTATNATLFRHKMWSYGSLNVSVVLQPGINYQMKMIVYGITNAANATITYDPATSNTQTNTTACGLRVAQIKTYDPVTNKTNSKYYKYATLGELTKSTGVGVIKPNMQIDPLSGGVCTPGWGELIVRCHESYPTLQVSSSSVLPVYTFGGSPVAYSSVIESDEPNLINGGIEHKFQTAYLFSGTQNILNGNILGAPLNTNADMNGKEESTIYFKKAEAYFFPVKEIINTYSFDSRVTSNLRSIVTRKRWEPPIQSNFSIEDKLAGFDLGLYYVYNSWIHLDKTVTKDYDQFGQSPVTTTVNYEYNNTVHLQPTRIETWNSKLESIVNTNTYPADYSSSVYNIMSSKNIITPVIESAITKNNTEINRVKTDYKDWFNDGKILKPELVSVKSSAGNPLEPRLRYYQYDNTGNPLEFSAENDAHKSYIWGYKKAYPVAEIANATNGSAPSLATVAYTSFEEDGDGNWVIFSSQRDNTNFLTGKNSYLLSNGGISRSFLDGSKTYLVSYWSNNGAQFVNGTTTAISGRSVNGWTYFEHKVVNPVSGIIGISGNGLIDELRLYPDKALMTTYTYSPLTGISSQCDANNRVTYYEYDGFNRLILIRDLDNNIVKKICYNYAGQVTTCLPSGCGTAAPDWQNTTTSLRCQLNLSNENTGYQEQEQKDMNTCSPTYNQLRWILFGYNTTTACPPPSAPANITITATAYIVLPGFQAEYTNTVTNVTYTFSIAATGGLQTLGFIPPGLYNLTISKPSGSNLSLEFGSGCNGMITTGTFAIFYNINVAASDCNSITIGGY